MIRPEELRQRIQALGPWFHNLNLNGIETAPGHFLGNYPACKFGTFHQAIPHDLTGKSVLDIGCNAGFYSIEMKRRGAARVVAIDSDTRYLNQARLAAEVTGAEIEFHHKNVYQVADLQEKFDVVLFMGVLYHLRHPLLALDLIHDHVARDVLIFQTLQRGSTSEPVVADDYDFEQTEVFDQPGYPVLYFVEKSYSHDPTNWWIPNRACAEAMLRSAGFTILSRPEGDVYICRREETRCEEFYG